MRYSFVLLSSLATLSLARPHRHHWHKEHPSDAPASVPTAPDYGDESTPAEIMPTPSVPVDDYPVPTSVQGNEETVEPPEQDEDEDQGGDSANPPAPADPPAPAPVPAPAPAPVDNKPVDNKPAETKPADTTGPKVVENAGVTPAASSDCKCGYILSSYENAYYPLRYTHDFSKDADKTMNSATDIQGWTISDGYGVGGEANGVKGMASLKNVKIQGGDLVLTVNQATKGSTNSIPSSEITFGTSVRGGVFITNAQLSKVPGSVQAFWTYHAGSGNDEQDIEYLGKTPNVIQYTNWAPQGGVNSYTEAPISADGYHNFTVGWFDDKTIYYVDGKAQPSPQKYFSTTPSNFIINHWSNGDWPGWPSQGNIDLKVRAVDLFYKTATGDGLPAGCTKEQACKI